MLASPNTVQAATEPNNGLRDGLADPIKVFPIVWYDGRIVQADDVDIHVMTHALHLGTSVFDGIRGYRVGGELRIFRLRDHLHRFRASAEVYGMKLPLDPDEMAAEVMDLCRRIGPPDCYIRPIAWYGYGPLGLVPWTSAPIHLMVLVMPLADFFGREALGEQSGLRLTVSPWRKTPSRSLPSWVKCGGHYTNSVLASSQACREGFDEALMLNDRGDVAEASCENLFLVKDGRLITNDRDADILPGITRNTVLEIAEEIGIPTLIRSISLNDVRAADEVFLTGTAAEVAPVDSVDEMVFASSRAGSVTRSLADAYSSVVRGIHLKAHWSEAC